MIVYLHDKYGHFIKNASFDCLPRIGETIQFKDKDFKFKSKVIDVIHNESFTTDIVLDYEGI